MVKAKPASARPRFNLFVRYTFHHNATLISPRDVNTIEHLLRRGRRQLETYEDPGVTDCWVSQEMKNWQTERLKGPK
jgi:succinate dehydrogenase assembly factor 1